MAPKTTWTEQARAVYVDPSGLAIVKGVNVQTALTEIDQYISNLELTGGSGVPGADGESAYQIWLDAGNTGTEEEFLTSLVGPQGDPGADGVDGIQGPPGPAGGSEVSSAVINANYNLINAQTDVPGATIVVPANSGPIELEVVGGIYATIVTGTNAAGTVISVQMQILDELNAVVGYSPEGCVATGASFSLPVTIPLGVSLANAAIDKTYRIQGRISTTNNAATGTLNFSGIFPARTFRAMRR